MAGEFFYCIFQGGINTSVFCGGIYVKSIVPGGPAAKEGRIMQGEGWALRSVVLGALAWGLQPASFAQLSLCSLYK